MSTNLHNDPWRHLGHLVRSVGCLSSRELRPEWLKRCRFCLSPAVVPAFVCPAPACGPVLPGRVSPRVTFYTPVHGQEASQRQRQEPSGGRLCCGPPGWVTWVYLTPAPWIDSPDPCLFYTCVGVTCTHIRKGLDSTWLRKTSPDESWNTCEVCEPENGDGRETPAVWMCLKCGHRVSNEACALVCRVLVGTALNVLRH